MEGEAGIKVMGDVGEFVSLGNDLVRKERLFMEEFMGRKMLV